MFDNQNTLMSLGGLPSTPPLPQAGMPATPAPNPQMQPGSAQAFAQRAGHGGPSPFNSQTLGGMTVQQILDTIHGGGSGMAGDLRNALMGMVNPNGGRMNIGQIFQGGFGHQSGGPVMTPGGGGTGAPLQGGTVGMVPGVPGSMGTNPGAAQMPMTPQPQNYQLPNY